MIFGFIPLDKSLCTCISDYDQNFQAVVKEPLILKHRVQREMESCLVIQISLVLVSHITFYNLF